MVNIIIENRSPELEDNYFRFETMRIHPHPLSKIIITFKNSRTATLYKNSTIKINGHKCHIDGEFYDLRENEIIDIHYFS